MSESCGSVFGGVFLVEPNALNLFEPQEDNDPFLSILGRKGRRKI